VQWIFNWKFSLRTGIPKQRDDELHSISSNFFWIFSSLKSIFLTFNWLKYGDINRYNKSHRIVLRAGPTNLQITITIQSNDSENILEVIITLRSGFRKESTTLRFEPAQVTWIVIRAGPTNFIRFLTYNYSK